MKKPPMVRKNTRYEETPLYVWMRNNGVSIYALSNALGVHKTSVQAWRVGSGLPSLPAAFRLEKVTRGAVPASSWLTTTIGRAMWAQMQQRARAASFHVARQEALPEGGKEAEMAAEDEE